MHLAATNTGQLEFSLLVTVLCFLAQGTHQRQGEITRGNGITMLDQPVDEAVEAITTETAQ